jgi:NAD(P)-dependent dehydrogenase (short-subunit alcohol dehydrogenase family)
MDLKGKVAVVTGGSSGIGRAVASALARAGVNVAIGARGQKRNLSVTDELSRQFGVQTLAIKTDVADEGNCERLIDSRDRRKIRNFSPVGE